ncbi:hypothetical protein [Paraburkholderia bannensis]|uniref:hypothetical protein n=1 Tax=Paraburkholderia bannensis TaxID=765414 RepID=UPI0005A7237A|nr:hypothetical protein [Paraburkholderia bannensis]
MKPGQIKPLNGQDIDAASGNFGIEVREAEQRESLLKLLALGRQEIEAGRVIPASDVFAELEQLDIKNGLA